MAKSHLCFFAVLLSLNVSKAETQGQKVFLANCSACHGASGRGDGPAAAAMKKTKPRNLVSDAFKKGDSREQITETVSAGLPPLMPAWRGQLSGDEIQAVVDHVLSIREKKK